MPAYIVFSDATLIAMAEQRPRTKEELLAVPGVGPKKLAAYGEAFLALLRETCVAAPAFTNSPLDPPYSNEQMYSAISPSTAMVKPLLPGTRKKLPAA